MRAVDGDDEREHADARAWETFCRDEAEHGRCPLSGATLRACVSSDLCDCFDYPESAFALGVAE